MRGADSTRGLVSLNSRTLCPVCFIDEKDVFVEKTQFDVNLPNTAKMGR